MKYLVIIILIGTLVFFLASNKEETTLQESIMSIPEKVQAFITDLRGVPDSPQEVMQPEDTTRYVSVTLKSGAAINGRLDSVTEEGEHSLSFPYGKIVIKKDDIVSMTDFEGDERTALKTELEEAKNFTGTGKEHTPIIPFEETTAQTATQSQSSSANTSQAFNKPIKWKKAFDMAKSCAKKESKIIMIDFSTTWCGWCTKLDKVTFADKNVRSFVNQHCIALKIDGDRDKILQKKYGVRGYPNIVFTDAAGKKLHQVGGFLPPQPFLAELKKAVAKK